MRTNKKISIFLTFIMLISIFSINFPSINVAASDESKVVFELSEDIAKDDGTQVELTLTVYNMKFKLMDFALGFDNTKVQLANKNTNAVSTTPAAVMTVLAKAFAENEETFEYEGWYVATKPVINNDYGNNTGAIWFGFYADDDSKGKVDGSNAEGYVEAGAEGLKVLKLHFRKLGNIDENTFKILTATDTGGNAATPSGLFLATDKGELTDSKYVVLPYQDENPTPTPVDKAPLAAKIAEAEDLLEAAEVGTAPGQYPEEAYNTFEAAINAAKAVNEDEDATQAEVDAAVEALEDAIAAFAAAEIEAPEVDKSALAAKIAEAKVLKESAEVGEEPGQYPEEAYNTFAAAIDAAEAVYDKADATQAEVDNAVAALEDAIEEFEDAKIPVEEPSDMPFEIINVTKEGTGDAVVKATIKKKGSYAGDYFVVAQIMDGTTPIITLGAKYSDDEREVVYTFEAKYTVEINIYSKLPEDTDGDGNIDDVGDILAEKVVR